MDSEHQICWHRHLGDTIEVCFEVDLCLILDSAINTFGGRPTQCVASIPRYSCYSIHNGGRPLAALLAFLVMLHLTELIAKCSSHLTI